MKDERERLAQDARRRHVIPTMTRWSQHRIRALLLTLLLALGMSVTFVQGGLMAAEMVVSAEAGGPGPSGCDGCGDDGEIDAGMCQSVCGSAAQGLLPGEPAPPLAFARTAFQAAFPVLDGRANRPDHGPPKTLTLG